MASGCRQSAPDVVLAAAIVIILNLMTQVDARAVGCGGKPADVVFMLDASNSIWGPDFRKQLHFVKDVIDWFTIGHNEMRVSVITYADYPQLQFHLHYYFTKDQLSRAVDNIRQNGGYHTITADALRYARRNVLGGRGDHIRENVTKVVVVITDGLSDNRTATALEAALTKEAGIHVFAVGVGKNVDLEELDAIASQPSMYYTFLVDGYEGLSNIRELLAIKTCTVTDPPTTTTTTTTTTAPSTTTTSAIAPTSTRSIEAISTESTYTTGKVSGRDLDGNEEERPRTPVILQPPTFLPIHTEKPLAELKALDQSNCSSSTEDQENGTKYDGKIEYGSENEVVGDPTRPCVSTVVAGKDQNQLNKTDSDDSSKKAKGKDFWLYDEHGYIIGSRFVKLKNRTTDVNGSDEETSTEKQTPSVVDTSLVPEERLKNISFEERRPYPDDPEVEVYFSSYPWGRGGYWYRDERLGYVWYRYISPGVFELDMNTTNKVRGASEAALESANKERVVTAPPLRSRHTTTSGTSDSSRYSASENPDRELNPSPDDATSSQSSTEVPSGYWGLDEHGRIVWHRYVAGVYQRLYPVTKTEDDHSTTLSAGNLPWTGTPAAAAAAAEVEGVPSTVRSQTASEEQHSGSGTEDGRNVEQAPDAIEFDFWRFVKGKRVSFQYVPPNGLDENDEELRLASETAFAGAVDVPSNTEVESTRDSDGTGKDWQYREEKRRVWHSSNNLKGGSISTEEIILDTKDPNAKETLSIRLDDDKGRELWDQLVNLTGGKLDHSKLPSEMKSRFGIIKDKLPEKQDGDNSEKTSDHFHESYWFTDDTGQRFQVIHKYNKSDDEPRKPLMDSHFPVGTNVGWTEEENEEHGLHVPEADGTWECERYGSEYWIRVLSSSKDAPRKPKHSLSHVLQLQKEVPSTPPLRRITPSPLPPQEFRAGSERKADETLKKDTPKRNKAKGKDKQKVEIKNRPTKQKGLHVGVKKTANRKSTAKGCRSRKPMDVIITIARRANRTSYADFMVNVTKSVVTHLNKTNVAVQMKFYPEIHNQLLESGQVVKAEDLTLTREPPAVTLTSISKILKRNAAESKRSGKKRSRKIIIYITDGRPVAEKQQKRKPPAKLSKDVELYVIGVGEETNAEDLDTIAKLSPSKSETQVLQKLNPHSNTSNLNDISEQLVTALCGA